MKKNPQLFNPMPPFLSIKTKVITTLSSLLLATQLFGADIQNNGQLEHIIPTATGKTQTIVLDQYQFSDSVLHGLATRLHKKPHLTLSADFLPRSVQLGMNGLPVFDQGRQDTCVTFAVTAAIDATLNRGPYISQLCLLRLGQYLERTNWQSSGWQGFSAAILLLNRIKEHGIISLENQQRYGCGGIFAYPLDKAVPAGEMSLKAYDLYHEFLAEDQVRWSSLWSIYGFLFETNSIMKVKQALSKGNRVTISMILPRIYLGVAGATATHHVADDTWVLTREIEHSLDKTMAGHEMVVTGYDDQAIAIDRNGDRHRGLFTLRNSWGPHVGDEGNFYVSYDYFEGLVMEAFQFGLP